VPSFIDALVPVLKERDLVILESTSLDGRTEWLYGEILKARADLEGGNLCCIWS
jgi:UDP-N-acetyl-D-mannosaminuronate dehydrogenase